MRRLGAGILFGYLVSACSEASLPQQLAPNDGGPSAPGGGVSAPWEVALGGLRTGGAVYSYRYDDGPPEGEFYRLAIHDTTTSAACARYSANSGALDGEDFWALAVEVNDETTGEHSIVTTTDDRTRRKTANVRLTHWKGGFWSEIYAALGGTVRVTSTPTPAGAKVGQSFDGVIEADFPTHAMLEVVCQAGSSPDGGDPFASCTCRDVGSVVTTCTPTDGENCCYDWTSPRTHVTVPFSAASCPAMCARLAGLPDYCSQSFGP